ncbi:MAG: galactitol-1-phosphate 5-dehydrogenase [Legionellales bacterium]|nr:galactitol-1-phosphate 5-dehydrogenase [Legionellales bacterium]
MKAAVLVDNKKIQIKDCEIPKIKEDECLVKVKNVGVCSSDIQRGFCQGAYSYPLVMGHELSGEVVEVGAIVNDIEKGDKVGIFPLLPCFNCEPCKQKKYVRCKSYGYYGSRRDGGYAEYLSVKSWNLIKIDKSLDYRDIACLEPMSVSLHCLKRLGINEKNSKNIIIIGAGFLGLIAAHILKSKYPAHKLTIVDRNSFKLNLAKKYSSETVLLKDQKDWEIFLEERARNYFDMVIEATGVPFSFVNSIHLTKEGGKCLWLGNIIDDLSIDKKTISSILRKEITILGSWNSDYDPESVKDDWRESIELIKKYGIQPSKFITHYIKLQEVQEYLLKLYNHKNRIEEFNAIKVMIEFS